MTGNRNTANGNFAGREVFGSNNTASGYNSGNDVDGDDNTASGLASGNDVTGNANTASGLASGQNVDGDANAAYGSRAGQNVTGDNNIAFGTNAGSGIDGDRTRVVRHDGVGTNALASADGAIAMGLNASAAHSNSAAFGNDATTTRANQQVFGTAANTYTMGGITSDASKTAQGAPTHLVTSNTGGDLAAYTFAELGLASSGDVSNLQSQINGLGRRDRELTEGIAAVAALAQPMLLPGQHFAMRAGWGSYDDANAVGFSAAGVVASNLLSQGRGTLTLDGGVGFGTSQGEVAGRAGASFGW